MTKTVIHFKGWRHFLASRSGCHDLSVHLSDPVEPRKKTKVLSERLARMKIIADDHKVVHRDSFKSPAVASAVRLKVHTLETSSHAFH